MSALTNIQIALAAQGIALAAQSDAIKSIVADLDGIKGQLDQAIASGADSAALQTIADQISRNTALLNDSTQSISAAIFHDVQHADQAGSASASATAANADAQPTQSGASETASATQDQATGANTAADTATAAPATGTPA